jgi:hypothetical protein
MGGATGKTDEVGAAERRALEHVARLSSGGPVDPRLRVTVNLTPDRPLPDGRTVLAGLADDGRYRSLGAELAVDGVLTPRILGEAWRTGRHDDQDLKRVWHLLARHGPVENEPVVIDKPG